MKQLFKQLVLAASLVLCISCFSSCLNGVGGDVDDQFSLIGIWGQVSSTITDKDGVVSRYPELGSGYYNYLEFKKDGSLARTVMPSGTVELGVYSYNEATHELSYKYDGYTYFSNGSVNVLSNKEMIINTDWGGVGKMTQYYVRIN